MGRHRKRLEEGMGMRLGEGIRMWLEEGMGIWLEETRLGEDLGKRLGKAWE